MGPQIPLMIVFENIFGTFVIECLGGLEIDFICVFFRSLISFLFQCVFPSRICNYLALFVQRLLDFEVWAFLLAM